MTTINFGALSALDTVSKSNAGAWMVVLTPRKQPTQIELLLQGRDSDRAKRIEFKDSNLYIEATRKGKGATIPEAETLYEKALWELAYLTKDWKGVPGKDGDAECTPENAYAFYKAFPDVFRQADLFVGDPANYGEQGEIQLSIFDPKIYAEELAKNSDSGLKSNSVGGTAHSSTTSSE